MKKNICIVLICLGIIFIVSGIVFMFIPNSNNVNNLSNEEKNSNEKWVLEGSTITKGNQSFQIGDYYEYDETDGGKISDLKDVKWKVMGVEDGNLLILSTSDVATLTLGKTDNLEISQNDYINGITKMNDLTNKYGNGNGAINARSVTFEDINKITGYNPDVDSKYYNVAVSYYWGSLDNPMYESPEFGNGVINLSHDGKFVWYDINTNKWNMNIKTGNETDDNRTMIVSLVNDLSSYDNSTYDENTDSFTYLLEENSSVFKMLYLDEDGNKANYWLANSFINASNVFSAYGYNVVKYDSVNYTYLVYSSGATRENIFGVRAVVVID